jgi:hypothetical protein
VSELPQRPSTRLKGAPGSEASGGVPRRPVGGVRGTAPRSPLHEARAFIFFAKVTNNTDTSVYVRLMTWRLLRFYMVFDFRKGPWELVLPPALGHG